MDTIPRTVGQFGDNATEAQAQALQQKLTALLEPILNELSAALQQEINAKVKAAKKRHNHKKWTDRDIDPYFFIAERLLLRNPDHPPDVEKDRNSQAHQTIQRWRQQSSINFETQSVSDWCLNHAQMIIKKKEHAARRKREKAKKREARNAQKRRSSGFYQGGVTPRTPRSLSPRPGAAITKK